MIKVLLVDDQELIRSALEQIVSRDPELQLAGVATNGLEALEVARNTDIDVIVSDWNMPSMDGEELTKKVTTEFPNVKVLILTTFETAEVTVSAIESGASGFIGKGSTSEEISSSIKKVAQGDAVLSPTATRFLISSRQAHPQQNENRLENLTQREIEVLTLVGKGMSNAEIAESLFISPLTAKTHVSNLFSKLNARDRSQLVIDAYELGLN